MKAHADADVPVPILFLSTKELKLKINHVVSEVATGVKTSCAILSCKNYVNLANLVEEEEFTNE